MRKRFLIVPVFLFVFSGLMLMGFHYQNKADAHDLMSLGPGDLQSPLLQLNAPAARRGLQVRDIKLITDTAGWVLADGTLYWTSTSGSGWLDITPSTDPLEKVLSACFRDEYNGDAVTARSSESGLVLTVLRTADGGRTWERKASISRTNDDLRSYSENVSLQFVDSSNGWMLVKLRSGSNFSRAELLHTSNGGSDWQKLPDPPAGGSIVFTSPTTGWLVGGAAGDQIYFTADRGVTWRSQAEKFLPAIPSRATNIVFDRPAFKNRREGKVLLTYVEKDRENLACYYTRNGGISWALDSLIDIGDAEQRRDQLPHSFMPNGDLITATLTPNETMRVRGSAKTVMTIVKETPSGLIPSDWPVVKMDFVSDTSGWVIVTVGRCLGFKTGCRNDSYILYTNDGGTTFDDITPNAADKEKALPGQAGQNLAETEIAPMSVVTLRNVEGFDKCEIPTTSQMQTWWSASPYFAAVGYIGGANRSCANTGITSGWITTVTGQGWGFVPIWLGLQAISSSCGGCSKMSSDPATAEGQGVAEANAAADRASVLGLTPQTVIYYDLESYDRGNTTARNAAKAFINGWVRRMHERGHIGSVYSSHPMFQDWTPGNIANPPDSIWFAWFFQDHVPCGTQCHTVFGVSDISDSLWTNDQRIRQTSSTIDRCYGGVCFTGSGGIDEDWLDGPVVGGGSGGCALTNNTPTIVSPGTGNGPGPVTANTTPTLTWNAVAGATNYGVFVRDVISNVLVVDNACAASGTSYTIPAGVLSNSRQYRWNIQANVSCGSCVSLFPSPLYFQTPAIQTPVITTSVTSLPNFGSVTVGQNSPTQSYTVSGSNLSGNVAIQAPAGFQISLNSTSGFASLINLTQSGGSVPTTAIFARFSPQTAGAQSGNISHASTGAATRNVAVSGTGALSTCTYSLSTPENTVGPGNGSTNFFMDASPGCSWTAVSDSNWLTTSSSGTGGHATITYNYAANSTTISRIGHITAGGQIHTVTQIGLGGAGSVQFSSASYAVNEGGGTATITVTRSSGIGSGNIGYASQNGTAAAGVDYNATSGLLIFAEGVTSRTFDVTILNDSVFEGDETINLSLTNPSNSVTLGTPGTATLTIVDDDTQPPVKKPFDYDGDGKTDVSVFRPSTGVWYLNRSQAGITAISWGISTDVITPADLDGDGKTDIAVFRPSEGRWYILNSATGTFSTSLWGTSTDIPTPADYDGDGKADISIFRPSSGTWWLNRSAAGTTTIPYGQNGDFPAVGDYDGDGKADIAVFRPSNGVWSLHRSSGGDTGYQFGFGTDKLAQADYDGDGKTDIAIYRPSEGKWYIAYSGTPTFISITFGAPSDIPAPGDYDGDGKADAAVFRPIDGNWWLNRSSAGVTVIGFGQSGDRPTPNAFGN